MCGAHIIFLAYIKLNCISYFRVAVILPEKSIFNKGEISMSKLIASYYNRIPMTIQGKTVNRPCKNYLSTIRLADIKVSNKLIDQLIHEDDLYTVTVYDKKDPDHMSFKTICVKRDSMQTVLDRCDSILASLVFPLNSECTEKVIVEGMNNILFISNIRNLLYRVYKNNSNYYFEVVRD